MSLDLSSNGSQKSRALDDLDKLTLISLVAKITSELENHLGVRDKELAESIVGLYEKSTDLEDFKQRVNKTGFVFTKSLIDSIDRFIRALHPKYKKKDGTNGSKHESRPIKVSAHDRPSRRKYRVSDSESSPEPESTWSSRNYKSPSPVTYKSRKLDYGDDHGRSSRYDNRSESRRKESSRRHGHDRHEDDYRDLRRHRNDRDEDDRHLRRYDSDRRKYEEDSSSRRRDRDRGREQELDDEPQINKIYIGRVANLKNFGAFVQVNGLKQSRDGLVHVSRIQNGTRVNHPEDILSRNQKVFVKVVGIDGSKIELSMSDVDQSTGEDLAPNLRLREAASTREYSSSSGYNTFQKKPAKKRLTSPERWEIKQLIASGAVSAGDYPDIDDDVMAVNDEADLEPEEDIDIEVKEEEPPFLAGQTKQSLELSPIRVVKAPDGSLYRAAMTGTTLAKDRREQRQAQAKEEAERQAKTTNLGEQWEDPMVKAGERVFADDIRDAMKQRQAPDMPEWKKRALNNSSSFGKITSLSIKDQRQSLPVFKLRQQLIDAVREQQLLIVVGDTGSGKTTQITQYLAEDGFADKGKIVCTQPRRVAATSVAKRVAEEVGCRVGEEVGYTIRFDDCTGPQTKIQYMTDGMLQRQVLLDPDLKQYSVIMLDEAHERTIATDVLFALLKKTLKRRPDLRLIVTSATLDAEKFSSYFNNCPILFIPGRTYPVDVMFTKEPETDYLDAALITVMQIHLTEPPGDILVFLTGQEEIDTSCEILFERMKALGPSVPELIILPVYSALPSEVQSRIFEPAPEGKRKVVIATNIAETSITIDGIYYVVDPGFVKINAFDPKLGMDSLVVLPISQAQARQRAGRAGRTGPGKCYRLYTESAFQNEMQPSTVPEIQRQNLSHTILMLKAMGINDLLHFDFMDPPPTNTMLSALEELYALSAVDDEGLLTRLGRKMADFPMDPGLAKVLIQSVDMAASEEILSIVAMLSVQTVFYRPKEKQQEADQKKAKFHDASGDHLTMLTVYNAWKQNGRSSQWCFENFIQARSMKRAQEVRDQLVSIMERYKHKIISCGADTDRVRKALCSGFFRNASRRDPQEGYRTLIEGTPVYMHPSSALFGKNPEYAIYHTLVLTSKEYMHCVTTIEPRWLVEAAPTFFKVADPSELSKRKKAERIQPLHNRFANPNDWRISQLRKPASRSGGTFG
ncbi:P-loop containing nucleoside triphosphate hydrolase protein [Lipomyces japonicus]|uniref:P-loop containing nucleoside triphosphate hydrolase protein n=1 Tax=Lipomyces japonicus TaxID=56871 RepID=UPI0034CF4F77